MRKVLRVIDSITEWVGNVVQWLALVLVVVMVYEVIMRYALNAPTVWGYEMARMLGATIYVLAFSYVQRHRGHIRVDIFYQRFSPRGKAILDVAGHLLFFFPLIFILIDTSFAKMWHAWSINEKMVESNWYPPVAPLRTVVTIGFCLFALQGVAQFIRDLYLIRRNQAYD